MKLLVQLLFVIAVAVNCDATSCPNTTATGDTKPLYLLLLVPHSRSVHHSLVAPRIAQEEINNHSDLLPGYHVELIVDTIEGCSSVEASIGLSNLIKHTVNPSCRPVIAVMGLRCSSHTAVLSPVAGHKGFDLIQLSSATSPIFDTQNSRFPHLWRFVGAATVYSDTVLAIMDQFNWTRVGIAYNLGSSLFSELAKDMEHKLKSNNRSVAFSLGIRETKSYYLDAVISNIKSKETGILVTMLSIKQTQALLLETYRKELTYPHYTWIHVAKRPLYYASYGKEFLNKTAFHHILLRTKYEFKDQDTLLVSNRTISSYRTRFKNLVKQLYNETVRFIGGSIYYDQTWAMALAVNRSIPELMSRNLSISNYTIGQHDITEVIEKQIKAASFQGAGRWVEFNQYQSGSSPVEILQMEKNGEARFVGRYDVLNDSDFSVNISTNEIPNDTVPRVYRYVLIPFSANVVLYILTGGVIVFTTIQLVIYFKHRKHKAIKATSPFLTLLEFTGCYIFCAAAVQYNTLGSFILSPQTFLVLSISYFFFTINGITLVFLPLFIKLVRLFRIFSFWDKNLSNRWNDAPLFFTTLVLSFLPNIGLAVLVALKPPTLSSYQFKFLQGNIPEVVVHTRIEPVSNYIFISLTAVYTTLFFALVVYMGILNRKINMKNFNSSCELFWLMSGLVISITLTISFIIIFLKTNQESIANTIMVAVLLVFVIACQLVLILPKNVGIIFEDTSVYDMYSRVIGRIGSFIFR